MDDDYDGTKFYKQLIQVDTACYYFILPGKVVETERCIYVQSREKLAHD